MRKTFDEGGRICLLLALVSRPFATQLSGTDLERCLFLAATKVWAAEI